MVMQVRPLESIVRRAPLGLRFQDLARGLDVTEGLAVSAWPIGSLPPGVTAERSPLSGIYGFRALSGLRDYAIGLRPASDWCVPAEAGVPNFVVQVEDRRQRFLPQAMRLCLPRERVVTVPLFSAGACAAAGHGCGLRAGLAARGRCAGAVAAGQRDHARGRYLCHDR